MAKVDLGQRADEFSPTDSVGGSRIEVSFPRIHLEKVPAELVGKDVGYSGKAEITFKISDKSEIEMNNNVPVMTMTLEVKDIDVKGSDEARIG